MGSDREMDDREAGGSDEHSRRRLAAALGPVGLWSFQFDRMTAARSREILAAIEELGFPAVWIPEGSRSKEALSHAGLLLGSSRRVIVATGVANIWARDPAAMANGARLLAEAYPGRIVLGMGVSHPESVRRRGAHEYRRPLTRMRGYLDAMDAARFEGPEPAEPAPRMLAALGRRMLALAAGRTAGAHTYFVPVEHTEAARTILGPGPVLAPEQAVVLERDPAEARRIARGHMAGYVRLTNYRSNLLRLGLTEDDLAGGCSDRAVDAVVAWGDAAAIRERVRAHLDAGADHVPVQVLPRIGVEFPLDDLRELAQALLA